jgi:demethylmenaquinone methyltransferase/2-methoxy-6-polyprenyl-1,4-benzoquinol methylase
MSSPGPVNPPAVIEDMKKYYQARAPEYDEWLLRKGRYDHGEEANSRWFADVALVQKALDNFCMEGEIAEIACGTGNWTVELLHHADHILAVDASPEMIRINGEKAADSRVTYLLHDIFEWQPNRIFDGLFFGFWISHVPLQKMDGFLGQCKSLLKPGGKIFFVDSRPDPTMSASNHTLPEPGSEIMKRKLNDGREFDIVKNFFDRESLEAQCLRAGLKVEVKQTPHYFIYAQGRAL